MADDRMYFCHVTTGYAVLISKMSAMDWTTEIANRQISNLTNWLSYNNDESVADKYWDWYTGDRKTSPFILLFDNSQDPSWEFDGWDPVEFNGTKIYKVKFPLTIIKTNAEVGGDK